MHVKILLIMYVCVLTAMCYQRDTEADYVMLTLGKMVTAGGTFAQITVDTDACYISALGGCRVFLLPSTSSRGLRVARSKAQEEQRQELEEQQEQQEPQLQLQQQHQPLPQQQQRTPRTRRPQRQQQQELLPLQQQQPPTQQTQRTRPPKQRKQQQPLQQHDTGSTMLPLRRRTLRKITDSQQLEVNVTVTELATFGLMIISPSIIIIIIIILVII